MNQKYLIINQKNIKKTIKKFDEDKYVNKNYNPYAIIGLLNNKKKSFS